MEDNRREYEVYDIWDPGAHERISITYPNKSAAKKAIVGVCDSCDTAFLKEDYPHLHIGDACPGCDDYCGGEIDHFYAD